MIYKVTTQISERIIDVTVNLFSSRSQRAHVHYTDLATRGEFGSLVCGPCTPGGPTSAGGTKKPCYVRFLARKELLEEDESNFLSFVT